MLSYISRCAAALFKIGATAAEAEVQELVLTRHEIMLPYINRIIASTLESTDEIDREFDIADEIIKLTDLASEHGIWLHKNKSLFQRVPPSDPNRHTIKRKGSS